MCGVTAYLFLNLALLLWDQCPVSAQFAVLLIQFEERICCLFKRVTSVSHATDKKFLSDKTRTHSKIIILGRSVPRMEFPAISDSPLSLGALLLGAKLYLCKCEGNWLILGGMVREFTQKNIRRLKLLSLWQVVASLRQPCGDWLSSFAHCCLIDSLKTRVLCTGEKTISKHKNFLSSLKRWKTVLMRGEEWSIF